MSETETDKTQTGNNIEDLSGFGQSPALYPQNFYPQRQSFFIVRLSEQDYRKASFLDNRVLTRNMQRGLIRESLVVDALAKGVNAQPLHFIFHCGHVGSTLLSRLLDEAGQVLSLREPLPLRVLADGYDGLVRREPPVSEARLNTYLELFLKIWSRGFPDTRAVIVKATSSAARLAPRLLAARPEPRAVYLSLPAEPYLATLLAGANSALDLKAFGPERARRLEALLSTSFPPFHLLSLGELAALSWLTERLTEKKLNAEFGSRILSLDFDEMLKDLKATLKHVTEHFQLEPEAKYFDEIAKSPVLSHYAKAPEHEYSPEKRAEILAKARTEKEADIKKGLAWLERVGAKHPNVAELLK